MQSIRILGIDAAFANTGLVLGEIDLASNKFTATEVRLITTAADKVNKKVVRKNSDDMRRAGEILLGLDTAIDEYKPHFAFCEVPVGSQNARASWTLGIALGMVAHVAQRLPLIQVTPKEVKEVVGLKFPDKAEMIAWAEGQYPDINWPRTAAGRIVAGKAEHMADACAAVHAGIQTDEFQRAVAMLKAFR